MVLRIEHRTDIHASTMVTFCIRLRCRFRKIQTSEDRPLLKSLILYSPIGIDSSHLPGEIFTVKRTLNYSLRKMNFLMRYLEFSDEIKLFPRNFNSDRI